MTNNVVFLSERMVGLTGSQAVSDNGHETAFLESGPPASKMRWPVALLGQFPLHDHNAPLFVKVQAPYQNGSESANLRPWQ